MSKIKIKERTKSTQKEDSILRRYSRQEYLRKMKKTYKLKGWAEELVRLTYTDSKLKKHSDEYSKINFSTQDRTEPYCEKL